jgi:transposase
MTRGQRKLSIREQHEVIRLYRAGELVTAIADRFGVSVSYPTTLAGRWGLESRLYHRPLAGRRAQEGEA